ncbi:MAG: hypothetical protein Q7J40_00155 [Atribacterota bacterium]|nr:hypothetical protein [Atribacterota bacterium]
MKRNVFILLIVLLILVISTLILFAEEGKYDFRKTNWGMSKEQVKEIEKSKFAEEDFGKEENLHYKGEVDGVNCEIYYYFMKGKLTSAAYGSTQSKDVCINNYKKFTEYLIKKYGNPVEDKTFEDFEKGTGLTSWDTPITKISLMLSEGRNKNEFNLGIYYQSKEGTEIKEKEDITLKQSKQQYDFRKANWRMSKEEVKATEDKRPDLEDDTELVYKVKIGEDNFLCVYSFIEDKFYRSTYLFDETHTNKNLYINDYERLKEILTKKYGKPTIDKIEWRNDLFKNDKQDWGTAISIGHLEYRTLWMMLIRLDIIEITLKLTGDNYEISLGILYRNDKLEKWAEQIKEKETSKGF